VRELTNASVANLLGSKWYFVHEYEVMYGQVSSISFGSGNDLAKIELDVHGVKYQIVSGNCYETEHAALLILRTKVSDALKRLEKIKEDLDSELDFKGGE